MASNNYFQFKQFIVYQNNDVLKVSTDACLQGALTPVTGNEKQILDIGCGTGILSLFMASKNSNAKIIAADNNPAAIAMANFNFTKNEIAINCSTLLTDINQSYQGFEDIDLIICNPPFYIDSLQSSQSNINKAKHNVSLQIADVLKISNTIMSNNAVLSVLATPISLENIKKTIEDLSLYINTIYFIKPSPAHICNRVIILFSKNNSNPINEIELCIKDISNKKYSAAFKEIMQAYYLKLD